MDHDRLVVLVYGPPGGGKTTWARRSGLDVYDVDDPRWHGSEARFLEAITALSRDPLARAAVIRSGATPAARARWSRRIAATLPLPIGVDLPLDELHRRILARNRPRPPLARQLSAARQWLERYRPDPVDVDGPFVAATAGSDRSNGHPLAVGSVCVPDTPRTSPNTLPDMSASPDPVST